MATVSHSTSGTILILVPAEQVVCSNYLNQTVFLLSIEEAESLAQDILDEVALLKVERDNALFAIMDD